MKNYNATFQLLFPPPNESYLSIFSIGLRKIGLWMEFHEEDIALAYPFIIELQICVHDMLADNKLQKCCYLFHSPVSYVIPIPIVFD